MKRINEGQIPEAVVLGSCLSLLGILGIYAWRNNTGAFHAKNGRLVKYGLAGSSDIIGICPDGRFLAVECKREGGQIRPTQRTFINKIKANGGVAGIVHDTDELMQLLKRERVI